MIPPARAVAPAVAPAVALVLALAAVACGGAEGEGSSAPSGSLGPVTQEAADEAMLGLCEVAEAADRESAEVAFLDRSHQTLHVIAAATEGVDREAAAGLLEAKQRVEADLSQTRLPPSFGDDVEALVEATRDALREIGLAAPECA